jgi:hypothetical protein
MKFGEYRDDRFSIGSKSSEARFLQLDIEKGEYPVGAWSIRRDDRGLDLLGLDVGKVR